MATLSVYIITHNEERALEDALKSVAFADEIVVLDSGSIDKTIDIARKYTDKVYSNTNWQGYGPQKNLAQTYCTGDWILSIDADERVSPALQRDVQNIVKNNDQSKAYAIPILPWVFGRFLRHGGWYPASKVRLYPRLKAEYGTQRVHEKLVYHEPLNIETLQADLYHFTYRDMEHYLVKSARYAAEWAEQKHQQGKSASLLTAVLHGSGCFIKIYLLKAGFLDGKQGFLIALLSAHSTFVKYADLWSRSQPPS